MNWILWSDGRNKILRLLAADFCFSQNYKFCAPTVWQCVRHYTSSGNIWPAPSSRHFFTKNKRNSILYRGEGWKPFLFISIFVHLSAWASKKECIWFAQTSPRLKQIEEHIFSTIVHKGSVFQLPLTYWSELSPVERFQSTFMRAQADI